MRIRKMLSVMMAFVLWLAMIPIPEVQATGTTYYVSEEAGNDSNAGAETTPVKTLRRALEVAGENDTIYVLDNLLVNDDSGKDEPLIIDEKVTIKGNAENLVSISLRAGGIILGADVTFQDIQIGFAGFVRPGIAANGHKLTLINVQQDASLRPLQIYGGTFYDTATGNAYGAEVQGSASNIVVSGGAYEAIYAGSCNGGFSLPVCISVSKGKGLSIGGIYAGNTTKEPGDTILAGRVPLLDYESELESAVKISVNDGAFVKGVDGVSEAHTVDLTVNGMGSYSFAVNCLDNLTVEGGTFIPSLESNFADSDSNVPNVVLMGSESNKATLDLSEYVATETELNVGNFTGSTNAILVIASDGTLNVTGKLSGNGTEFRVDGGMPWNSVVNPGYSGWIEYETQYIFSQSGDGSFVISNPYPTQKDIAFTEESSAAVGWTTVAGSGFVPAQLVEFLPIPKTISYEDMNVYAVGSVDVIASYTEDELYPYIDSVPISYQVSYTDEAGNVTNYIEQDSVLNEVDDTIYYSCNYVASTASGESTDVLMVFEPYADQINIYPDFNEIAAGTYEITMTALTVAGEVSKTFTLTVLPEGDIAPTETATYLSLSTEAVIYGDGITVEASVKESGVTVLEGTVQLYINGEPVGDVVDLSEGIAIWENFSVLAEHNFRMGFSEVVVLYQGTEKYSASISEMSYVEVTKAVSSILCSNSTDAQYEYDGLNHPFTPAVGTVSILNEAGHVLASEITEKDYVITYTTGTEEEGNLISHAVPNLPGEYTVWLRALGTDFWFESEEIVVGTIVITEHVHRGGTATCQSPAVCEGCGESYGEKDRSNHVSVSEKWSNDEAEHWHACACGVKVSSAAHVPGAEATEESAQTCTVCGYEIAPKLEHVHRGGTATCQSPAVCEGCGESYGEKDISNHVSVSEKWSSDEAEHWHACVCGVKVDSAVHVPGEEATEEHAQTCTVCGYELAPKLEPTPEEPQTPEQQVKAFVERMYTVALGREAETEGLEFWTASLLSKTNDGAGLAQGFLLCTEFENKDYCDSAYVEVLYATFFDREPDADGVAFWTEVLADGASRESVLAGFVNSGEFFALCHEFGISRGVMLADGTAINAGIGRFTERLYTMILERASEEEGMEFWATAIAKKESAPEEAAINFFRSQEYLNKNTDNETYVKALYRTFMDRECDESGLKFWVDSLNGGNDRENVLKGFAESDEFQKIMNGYGL